MGFTNEKRQVTSVCCHGSVRPRGVLKKVKPLGLRTFPKFEVRHGSKPCSLHAIFNCAVPLRRLPYDTLDALIEDNLSTEEWDHTCQLIRKLRPAKSRGWLTKPELIEICYWKSPRAIKYIKSNRSDTIRKVTGVALKSRSEQLKITELTKLRGVSLPMASSILMLTNPKRYGVLDIRVWEVMFRIGSTSTNPKGVNFRFNEWYLYLMILRSFANKLRVNARDIERTLFAVHKKHQEGTLYNNLTARRKAVL